jgi:putative ABC transport system permease protein
LEARLVRIADVFRLSLGALWRQKVRTLLTGLGVVCGAFVLVFSLSVNQGVQETILREARRYGDLRMMLVHSGEPAPDAAAEEEPPVKGEMGEDKRERLREALSKGRRWDRRPAPEAMLTRDRIRDLEKIPHVLSAVPAGVNFGRLVVGNKAEYANVAAAAPHDEEYFRGLVVAGDYLSGPDAHEVLIDELLLYRLGVADDSEVARLIGSRCRLEFRQGGREPTLLLALLNPGGKADTTDEETVLAKAVDRLPGVVDQLGLSEKETATLRDLLSRKPKTPTPTPPPAEGVVTEEYTVRGVLRVAGDEDGRGPWNWNRQTQVLLPPRTAEELIDRLPWTQQYGFNAVTVEVDDMDNVKAVSAEVKAMGLNPDALLDHVEREQFTYHLIFTTMTLVAAMALIVAALGIANTMLMGVLERVREIGVMKAVGARDGHIQLIFLVEGALIGLVGGVLGLALAWAVSGPADAWMRSMLAAHTTHKLSGTVFVFPPWLVVGAPAFACLATTLAAVYPARRAAKVNTVEALRHE